MSRARNPDIRIIQDTCRICGKDGEVYAHWQDDAVGGRAGTCLTCCSARSVEVQRAENAASIPTATKRDKKWSDEELRALREMYEHGDPVLDICKTLGRTAFSVRRRLSMRGIKRPPDYSPRSKRTQ